MAASRKRFHPGTTDKDHKTDLNGGPNLVAATPGVVDNDDGLKLGSSVRRAGSSDDDRVEGLTRTSRADSDRTPVDNYRGKQTKVFSGLEWLYKAASINVARC